LDDGSAIGKSGQTGTGDFIICTQSENGSGIIRVNGTEQTLLDTYPAGPTVVDMSLVGLRGTSTYSDGDIGQILHTSTVLTTAEIETTEAYLSAKFGITV